MDATLAIVIGAAVALQALQTAQIFILRRDVRRTLFPPPPPPPPPATIHHYRGEDRCVVCGETLTRAETASSRTLLGRKVCTGCDLKGRD